MASNDERDLYRRLADALYRRQTSTSSPAEKAYAARLASHLGERYQAQGGTVVNAGRRLGTTVVQSPPISPILETADVGDLLLRADVLNQAKISYQQTARNVGEFPKPQGLGRFSIPKLPSLGERINANQERERLERTQRLERAYNRAAEANVKSWRKLGLLKEGSAGVRGTKGLEDVAKILDNAPVSTRFSSLSEIWKLRHSFGKYASYALFGLDILASEQKTPAIYGGLAIFGAGRLLRKTPWWAQLAGRIGAYATGRFLGSALTKAHTPDIEGLDEGGISNVTRKVYTNFGSGWAGLSNLFSTVPYALGMDVDPRILAFRRQVMDIPEEKAALQYRLQLAQRQAMAEISTFGQEDFLAGTSAAGIQGLVYAQSLREVDLAKFRVSVEDADTLILKRRGFRNFFSKPVQVRLAGIDAPEVAGHSFDPMAEVRLWQAQPGGEEAAAELRKIIRQQKDLRLVVDTRRQTYGRSLGALVGDRGLNINIELARRGAVAALPFGPRSEDIVSRSAVALAEERAVAQNEGMWQYARYQAAREATIASGRPVTFNTITQINRMAANLTYGRYGTFLQSFGSQRRGLTPEEQVIAQELGVALRPRWKIRNAAPGRSLDRAHNPEIQGLQEGGVASFLRKAWTDFGSGVRRPLMKALRTILETAGISSAELTKGNIAPTRMYGAFEQYLKSENVLVLRKKADLRKALTSRYGKLVGKQHYKLFVESVFEKSQLGRFFSAEQTIGQVLGQNVIALQPKSLGENLQAMFTTRLSSSERQALTLAHESFEYIYSKRLGKGSLDPGQLLGHIVPGVELAEAQTAGLMGAKVAKASVYKMAIEARGFHQNLAERFGSIRAASELARISTKAEALLGRINPSSVGKTILGGKGKIRRRELAFITSAPEVLDKIYAKAGLLEQVRPELEALRKASREISKEAVGFAGFMESTFGQSTTSDAIRQIANKHISRASRRVESINVSNPHMSMRKVHDAGIRGIANTGEAGRANRERGLHSGFDPMRRFAAMVGKSVGEIVKTRAFQEALRGGTVVKKIGEGGIGSVELMQAELKGTAFGLKEGESFTLRYAAKHYAYQGGQGFEASLRRAERAGLEALQETIAPTPYGHALAEGSKGRKEKVLYMEYLEGAETLEKHMSRGRRFTGEQYRELKKGIDTLHTKGLAHADLTVLNVMIGSKGQVYLIDPMPTRWIKMQGAQGRNMKAILSEDTQFVRLAQDELAMHHLSEWSKLQVGEVGKESTAHLKRALALVQNAYQPLLRQSKKHGAEAQGVYSALMKKAQSLADRTAFCPANTVASSDYAVGIEALGTEKALLNANQARRVGSLQERQALADKAFQTVPEQPSRRHTKMDQSSFDIEEIVNRGKTVPAGPRGMRRS